MENPQGFGLLQRGRQFSRFEDLDDRYDLRPSAWVTPKVTGVKGRLSWLKFQPTMKPTITSCLLDAGSAAGSR
jgi:glucans biosynthesis protein